VVRKTVMQIEFVADATDEHIITYIAVPFIGQISIGTSPLWTGKRLPPITKKLRPHGLWQFRTYDNIWYTHCSNVYYICNTVL